MRNTLIGMFFILVFTVATVSAGAATDPTASVANMTIVTANQTAPLSNQTGPSEADRIAILENNTQVLQTQLGALNQKLDTFEQEIQKIKEAQNSFLTQLTLASNIKSWLSILTAAVIVILLLMLIHWFVSGTKKTAATKGSPKEDFDLMNASEGIAAKLNLARAYLDMQNMEAAKSLLQEVVASGDAAQQQEARALLDKIPANG